MRTRAQWDNVIVNAKQELQNPTDTTSKYDKYEHLIELAQLEVLIDIQELLGYIARNLVPPGNP